jgi:hypothetical protein
MLNYSIQFNSIQFNEQVIEKHKYSTINTNTNTQLIRIASLLTHVTHHLISTTPCALPRSNCPSSSSSPAHQNMPHVRLVMYLSKWKNLRLRERQEKHDLLLEFYVNQSCRRICDGAKCGRGEDYGSPIRWRPWPWCLCSINNPNLNDFVWKASSRDSCTDASHQVLSPTCCTIVPYSLAGRGKNVAWREMW